MKRALVLIAGLAIVLPAPAAAKQLTILHSNDIHSHIAPHGPGGRYGGDDRIAHLINEIRATNPNVLVLDAGDWVEGTMYYRFNEPASVARYQWAGTADLHMFEVMGYDAVVLGNHDYTDFNRTIDNGNPPPDTIIERLQRADNSYPILSYNFRSSAVPALDPYLVDQGDTQPFAVFDVGGVRVAMAGMTEELFAYQMYLADSSLDDPTGSYAQPVIDQMNAIAPAPDVTMLLNHVGHGDDRDIVANTTGLDLIVGGHSHSRLFTVDMAPNAVGDLVPVVQAGEYSLFLGRLDLDIDDTTGAVTVTNYELIPIDQNTPSDPVVGAEVDLFTAALLAKHGPVFTDTVATSATDISHDARESSIGNMVVDAVLAKARSLDTADLCLISEGAISNPGHTWLNGLRPGNVTTADVERIYGTGYNPQLDKSYRIYVVDYLGSEIRWLQETFNFGDLVASLGEGLFLSMAGGQITYDMSLPDGSRITSFTVGGVPLVDGQTYSVTLGEGELAVLDYLTNLGLIPFNYTNKRNLQVEVWQALKEHLAGLGTVTTADVDVEGRYRTVPQDLGIQNYDINVTPATYQVGDQVTIEVTVANFGETASSGGTLEVYYDKTPLEWADDPAYDSSSLIASVPVPAVPAFPGSTVIPIAWDTTGLRPGQIPLYARLVGLSEQNGTNHFAFRFTDGLQIPWQLATGPGAGPANAPTLRVWSGLGTPNLQSEVAAYGATGYGVNVAGGDIDGTATDDEALTGAGPGAVYGPQFRAFRLDGTAVAKVNGYAYGTLRYGVNVAGTDLDGDGYAEVLTGAGPGEVFGPHVRAFNYDGSSQTAIQKVNFFAYGSLKWGVNVGRGDIDGDAIGEVLTAPGPSPTFGPQIRAFNYDGVSVSSIAKVNFNAFSTPSYGARTDGANVDSDTFDEIIVAPGPGPTLPAQVRGFNYDGVGIAALAKVNFFAYSSYFYGARLAGGDVDVDGFDEILVSPGPDPAAEARVRGANVDGATGLPAGELDFLVYDPESYGANAAVLYLAP